MADHLTRREFVQQTAGVAAAASAARLFAQDSSASKDEKKPMQTPTSMSPPLYPVVLSSSTKPDTVEKAAELIRAAVDPLEGVVTGVGLVEADPNDLSVGLGGLPNEDGVVECDACVMHGPLHRAGAVAALRDTIYSARVAKLVMERTDHVLLVGEGALKFAKAHGFGRDNMLTEAARKAWLEWKETHSGDDNWLPPQDTVGMIRAQGEPPFTWGTIHCAVVDPHRNCFAATTTSGRSYKLAGRVGDSPIIGAGCYVDNDIGCAGGTGRGEAAMTDCAAFSVVDKMGAGRSPSEACLEVLKKIVDHNRQPRLRGKEGRPLFQLALYALGKDGRFGAAAIWSGVRFSVFTGGRSRIENADFLYPREETSR